MMKLKFAIMVNDLHLSAWEKEVVDLLLQTGFCDLKLIIINDPAPVAKNSFFKRIHFVAYKLFVKLFIAKAKALTKRDCTKDFSAITQIKCRPHRKGRFLEYFQKTDIEQIAEQELDFIFRFGFNILRGDILNVPKYGIWSYHHGDEKKYRGGPAGLWEIINNDPETGVILQRLTDQLDRGFILKKGYYKTIDYSYAKQIDQLYFKPTNYALSIVHQIINGKADQLFENPSDSNAPIYKVPHNRKTLHLMAKLSINFIKKEYKTLFKSEFWEMAYQDGETLSIRRNKSKNCFAADIFPIERDGNQYVFFEQYDYKTAKGEIYYCLYQDSHYTDPKPAIVEDFHLSYPYIFKDKDDFYCMPEMSASGEQWIYKAINFPDRWEKHIKITNQALVDPTLFYHNESWYLFYTDPQRDANTDLCLKYASDLKDQWFDHPMNPVVVDIKGSRPAGKIYTIEDQLIRPSQTSLNHYGQGIALKKIISLNKEEYTEELFQNITPPNPYIGIHTTNEKFIDIKTYRFQFPHLKRSLRRYLP